MNVKFVTLWVLQKSLKQDSSLYSQIKSNEGKHKKE